MSGAFGSFAFKSTTTISRQQQHLPETYPTPTITVQTKTKSQPTPKTSFRKQPEKRLAHTNHSKNNQKENLKIIAISAEINKKEEREK